MGYVNEPDGVDFYLDPKPLTDKNKREISEVIAYYKSTGRKKKIAGYKQSKESMKNAATMEESVSNRFLIYFMIQLSANEWESLRLQIETSKGRGGTRYLPYVLT